MTYPPGSDPQGGGPVPPQAEPSGQPGGPQDASWWETSGQASEPTVLRPQGGLAGSQVRQHDSGWAQPQDSGWAATQPGAGQAQPYDAGWGTGGAPQPGYQPGFQQPGYQPGWNAQPGYPGGAPAAPQRRTGLIVGIATGVVALLVIGIALVVTFTGNSSSPTAEPKPPVPSSSSLSPATSTSAAPTTSSSSSARFSYAQYAKNWDFKMDSVQLHADWVQGRDDPTCAPVEVTHKFSDLGCQYAAELVYKAEGGALMLTQFVMGMSDQAAAAAAPGKYTDADLKLRPGTYISHFAVGKWKGGAQGQFLVTTIATATQAVPEATAVKYLRYMQSDMVGALMFR